MTRAEFARAYADALRERGARDPEYAYAAADADAAAGRMLAALAAARADVHGSPVLARLARVYGVRHTHNGWQSFVAALGD